MEKIEVDIMNWLGNMIQQEITESDEVLSLGCGIFNDISGLKCKKLSGIDIFEPYVKKTQASGFDAMLGDVTTYPFKEKQYDVVLALDLLEHLNLEDALRMLSAMKNVARKKVILYTPTKFHDNAHNMRNIETDHHSPYKGLGLNTHQLHKCVIHAADLAEHGYKVIEVNGGYYAVFTF